jgi:hypothetical protein
MAPILYCDVDDPYTVITPDLGYVWPSAFRICYDKWSAAMDKCKGDKIE